jgi:hypothetical protein
MLPARLAHKPARQGSPRLPAKKSRHESAGDPTTWGLCVKLPTLQRPRSRQPRSCRNVFVFTASSFVAASSFAASRRCANQQTCTAIGTDDDFAKLLRNNSRSEALRATRTRQLVTPPIGHATTMSKQEDYRHTAAEIVELAQKATTVIEKRRLLRLAEMWLDLAVRSGRKTAQRQIGDHPLVRKALGSDPAGM